MFKESKQGRESGTSSEHELETWSRSCCCLAVWFCLPDGRLCPCPPPSFLLCTPGAAPPSHCCWEQTRASRYFQCSVNVAEIHGSSFSAAPRVPSPPDLLQLCVGIATVLYASSVTLALAFSPTHLFLDLLINSRSILEPELYFFVFFYPFLPKSPWPWF